MLTKREVLIYIYKYIFLYNIFCFDYMRSIFSLQNSVLLDFIDFHKSALSSDILYSYNQ